MEQHLLMLFSQILLLLERKEADCLCFHVEKGLFLEKGAANLIRKHKIAFSTLKLAFGF